MDNVIDLYEWKKKESSLKDCINLAVNEAQDSEISLQEFLTMVINLWNKSEKF